MGISRKAEQRAEQCSEQGAEKYMPHASLVMLLAVALISISMAASPLLAQNEAAAAVNEASGAAEKSSDVTANDPEARASIKRNAPTAEELAIVGEPVEDTKTSERERISHKALIDGILRNMSSPDPATRIKAGLALRQTAKLSDVPELVKVLKRGNNKEKQLFLIKTLGELSDRRSAEALRFEVRHGSEDTRLAAIEALGELRFDWPVPILVRALRRSEDTEVKKRAASALGRIGTSQAEYALRTSLGGLEEYPGARNAAFWALEKARGEVDDTRTDTHMPSGRRVELYYKGMRYFFYHPAQRKTSVESKKGLRPWLMVCVHDNDLRAEDVFTICQRAAKKRRMAVLAPFFDDMQFPEYGTFNLHGVRSDKRLLELVEHVGKHASLSVREFYLFGYGKGGDFAMRFAHVYPKRLARVAYEADSFMRTDPEILFPEGLHRTPIAPDLAVDMYDVAKTNMLVIQRQDAASLRESRHYFESVIHYADVNGIRSRISKRKVDATYDIWREAERYLFSYDLF